MGSLKYDTAVYISSINRPKQLAMAVNSVPEKYKVLVHCHNINIDACVKFNRPADVCEYPNMSRTDRGNLAAKKLDGYNMFPMCDDTRIFIDTIGLAEEKIEKEFNSTMAVCGIKQFNIGQTQCNLDFAFCLYGNEWINQFIDRRLDSGIYDKYYVDYEWYVNACARNCWTVSEDSQIIHKHMFLDKPDMNKFNQDLIRDRDIFIERMKRGQCWGITEGCLNPVEKIKVVLKNGDSI